MSLGQGRVSATTASAAYRRVEELIAQEVCVVLDGGMATELERRRGAGVEPDAGLWGTWALFRSPQTVLDVHASYVAAGCDVISTDTWSILSAPELELRRGPGAGEAVHWIDVARLGVRLARRAVDEGGRVGECAVAFAISEEVNSPQRRGTLELLARVFEEEPPDLILLETLTLIREPETFETVRAPARDGSPACGSRSGVAGTASAGCSASTGARPRAICSAARRAASRRWASARC